MSKSKAQRYTRKDYSQFIEFPVEIVGRDGVIRQYTFEQSIHLYQQRMSSARQRYQNHEVVDAEVVHCSKRIAQLRRSYFARYGWESYRFEGQPPERLTMEAAGEIAAFLRTQFGCGARNATAQISCISEDEHEIVFLFNLVKVDKTYLLYLHYSEERYQQFAIAHNHQLSEQVDKVLLTHDGKNIWLSLTGKSLDGIESQQDDVPLTTPLHQALAAVQKGDLRQAVARFVIAFEDNPYQRGAYWGAAIVSEQLSAYAEAEMALQMGVRYFPNDAGLRLRLVASLIRRIAYKEAQNHLDMVVKISGESVLSKYLQALIDLQSGALRRGQNRLTKVLEELRAYPAIYLGGNWLLSQLRARSLLRMLGLVIAIISIYAALLGWSWMWLGCLALLLLPLAHQAWYRQYNGSLTGASQRQLMLLPSTDLQQVNHLLPLHN